MNKPHPPASPVKYPKGEAPKHTLQHEQEHEQASKDEYQRWRTKVDYDRASAEDMGQ